MKENKRKAKQMAKNDKFAEDLDIMFRKMREKSADGPSAGDILKLHHLINKYGMFRNSRMNSSFAVIGNATPRLYLSLEGQQIYDEKVRDYNSDKTLYMLQGPHHIAALVSAEDGEIVWLHKPCRSKWKKDRILDFFSRLLTFHILSSIVKDDILVVFEDIGAREKTGLGKEFFDAVHKGVVPRF